MGHHHGFTSVLRQAEADVFGKGQHFHKSVDWGSAPLMPVEFFVAAYRFGHAQVRSRYTINPGRHEVDLFQPPASGLTSFSAVPRDNVVDWDFFPRTWSRIGRVRRALVHAQSEVSFRLA